MASMKFEAGFIGGGNMAEAIIRGMIAAGTDPAAIAVSEPNAARRRTLVRKFGVAGVEGNVDVASASSVVVLAVKPQIMAVVLEGLKGNVGKRTLVVSIAAGVKIKALEKGLGEGVRVIRAMPNTPCLVGRGATVLAAGTFAKRVDMTRARKIFASVGKAWVAEAEKTLDPVTGLSGSGPAYVYLFAESLIRGGRKAGLTEEMATELAYQTIAGAAEMMQTTGTSPADLRKAVSSPGGTTVAGLGRLAEGDFEKTVAEAVKTATRRSRELGRG